MLNKSRESRDEQASLALARFCETRSDTDFEKLVKAFGGLVYGTAMRRTGDPELSKEVMQNVFTILAKKAKSIRDGQKLASWLHRVAVLEASSSLRKEQTRKRKMKEFEEKHHTAECHQDPAWNESLPHLDEAINHLREKDRQAILMRFFEKRSFREIGIAMGKSEEASRMQIKRALKKLNQCLSKKQAGLALTAGALSTGLGTELAKAASANLITSTVHQSLAAASIKSPILSSLIIHWTIMKTSTSIAVSSIFLLATGSGAYLLGKYDTPPGNDGNLTSAISALSQKKIQPSRTFIEESSSINEQSMPQNLDSVLRKIANLYRRADDHPDGLLQAEALLSNIPDSALKEAAKFLTSLKEEEEIFLRMSKAILPRWGATKGETALLGAMALDKDFMQMVLTGWAQENGQEVYQHYQSIRDTRLLGERHQFLGALFTGWLHQDLDAAMTSFESMTLDDQYPALSAIKDGIQDEGLRDDLTARISKIANDGIKIKIIRQAIYDLQDDNPQDAADLFDSIQFETPGNGFPTAFHFADHWASQDAKRALQWIWKKTPKNSRHKVITSLVRKHWAKQDKGSADAWLEEQGYSPEKVAPEH